MEKLEKFTADQKLVLPEDEGKKVIMDAEYIGRSAYSKDSAWYIWQIEDNNDLDNKYYISLNDSPRMVWAVTLEDVKAYREFDSENKPLTFPKAEKTFSESEVKDIAIVFSECMVHNKMTAVFKDCGSQNIKSELFTSFLTTYYKK